MAIDLSKQQTLDADPKALQQINLKWNLAQNPFANTTIEDRNNFHRIKSFSVVETIIIY